MSGKLIAALALGLVGLLINQPAFGADFEPHAFVTASIGQSSTDYQPSLTDVIDDDDTSFAVGLGYAFSRHWSVQGRYYDFGEHEGSIGCPPDVFCIAVVPFAIENVDVDGWSAVVDGTWPVSERVSLFARAGVLAWEVSAVPINTQHVMHEIDRTQPLSVVMAETVAQLRAWADGRTVASC